LRTAIRAAETELLRDLVLFDVYTGKNIESGRKSLALGLILQASSQTLTDDVIEDTVRRILARLASEFGARLRD
jgi:phenylalanyl-tRNA synthetase beta chain